jgi:hypothetical protein
MAFMKSGTRGFLVLIALVMGMGSAIGGSLYFGNVSLQTNYQLANSSVTDSLPYCNFTSSLAVLNILPQIESSHAFENASAHYSNWVLEGSSFENFTDSSLGATNYTVRQLQLEFATFSQSLTPNLLCATSLSQRILFVLIPITPDGSYNMSAIKAYSQTPYSP